MKKRILPLFLCICLMAALILSAAAFTDVKPSYLALGDSITTGYAPGGGSVAEPFAAQLAERNDYELTNLASNGETAGSLLKKLESASEGESTGSAQAVGKALPEADLITVTIGGNDLMNALYGFLTDEYNEGKSTDRQITEYELMEAIQNPSQNLLFLYGIIGSLGSFDGSDAEMAALASYGENLEDILNAIQAKNPSAKIVVINQYNPYGHIADGGTGIAEAFEKGVSRLNEKTGEVCQSNGADVADVYTAFRNTGGSLCNAYFNSLQDFDLDFHPSQSGHDVIADVLSGLLQDGSQPQQNENLPFSDVQDTDWFYDAADYVFRNGLMNGTSQDTFSPDGTMSRGMIVTVLWRIENRPGHDSSVSFSDTASGAYYAEAVGWAAEAGIVTGYGDGTFGPDDSVTREQMAAILYRYARYGAYDVTETAEDDIESCADFKQISEYAVPAMEWAWKTGLIRGTGGGMLSPQGTATRAQTAAMLMRFCGAAA